MKSKHKRFKKKIRNAKWRAHKKWALQNGWIEPNMNMLVPSSYDSWWKHTPEKGWTPMRP